MQEMTPKRFERIARRALASLPPMFQPYVRNLVLTIEPYPSEELLDDLGVPEDEDLFGLYEGPSLTEQNASDPPELPPRIILYFEPLLDACETEEELIHEIQATVLHEIGHFFGLDEERLAELGYE
ncbi:MAG: metallopeptidase family protein [Planctomycetota bacterium]|nr:metallopeptidase family protein [Planctomycetota bacterium]